MHSLGIVLSLGVIGAFAIGGCGSGGQTTDLAMMGNMDSGAMDLAMPARTPIKTVFLIMLENHNWSDIKDSPSAPYINKTLLPMASHAENYFNPPNLHPSEPNYLWLEAGTNFNVLDDAPPAVNHQSSTAHLATLLGKANVSWKAYQEDISGTVCPLISVRKYAPKHDPFVFFDDMTGSGKANNQFCIDHNRPYTELATDLKNDTVARYNFITPNLCNDMHDVCALGDEIKQGDNFIAAIVPALMESKAYKAGGLIVITFDESENGDFPIGMIVVSNSAKGGGYAGTLAYTHSSLLRSLQEIFGVTTPFLGDAATATDLADLFTAFP